MVHAKAINEMVRRLINLREWGDLVGRFLRRIIGTQIRSVGIDLGKTTFHLVALGERGKVLLRKKFSAALPLNSALAERSLGS